VGVALLLEYLAVVLVVGWLWLRHGQRPRRLTVAGGTAAIAGLVMVLNLTGPAHLNPLGVVWALLAAVGLATYFMLSAADHAEPLPPIVMAWAGMCVAAAALAALGWARMLPMTATTGDIRLLGHEVSWIVPVLGLSVLASVVAYVAGIGAARRLGAKLASFAGMAEVLFAIVFAWLLLGQLPSAVQFIGGAFILAGVTLVRADELRHGPPPARQPSRPRAAAPGLAGRAYGPD
jgi:drug/metabolite transporter (DMT)-like permease